MTAWFYGLPSLIERKPRRRRSAVAADLRTPKYRPRIVKSRKAYSRKSRNSQSED